MAKTATIPTSDVVYRGDLYPRLNTSPSTVQKYAADLSVLPPIEVNQHNELIDGWHRWTAHIKNEVEEIDVITTETTSDAHLLELAIERNASFGLQLSQGDKKAMAVRIYLATATTDRSDKKKLLMKILSCSASTLKNWLSDVDRAEKERVKALAWKMWLACYKQQEIAEACGDVAQQTVADWTASFTEIDNLAKSGKTLADFAEPDWETPLYNVWVKGKKSGDLEHFGNSETTWVDRLVYLYTDPFDIVVDPFAGSGSTIDVCRNRSRRYIVSDRKPIVERSGPTEIRKHDLTDGIPTAAWQDVRLVYLDPPYWKQAENQYSTDPTDLANMDVDDFNKNLSAIINGYAKKLTNAHIALIIQPTQWNAPNREFTDHVGDMLKAVKLKVVTRIQAPYQSEQCNAQMVIWAKEKKQLLTLSREIIVWKVA